MKKQILIGAAFAVFSAAAIGLVTSNLVQAQSLAGNDRQTAILNANKAINALDKIEGNFVQTNPNKSKYSGRFWLDRPGRMRFEYSAPVTTLMVANDSTIAITDAKLLSVDKYPLRQSPLYFLLKSNVDLGKEVKVTAVNRSGSNTEIAMRDARNEAQGELTLVFDAKNTLLGWRVIDGRKQLTMVTLSNVKKSGNLDAKLFAIPKSKVVKPLTKGGK